MICYSSPNITWAIKQRRNQWVEIRNSWYGKGVENKRVKDDFKVDYEEVMYIQI